MNGTYRYWMNGTQADITETFRITSTGGADTTIEAFRHAEAFGSQIKVVANDDRWKRIKNGAAVARELATKKTIGEQDQQ